MKTLVLYNYQSLQVEYGIKSLSNILTKHLTNLGQMWTKYLPLATFAYNTFNTKFQESESAYEFIFGRKPRSSLSLDSTPDIKVSGSFREYYDLLLKKLKYLHNLFLNF